MNEATADSKAERHVMDWSPQPPLMGTDSKPRASGRHLMAVDPEQEPPASNRHLMAVDPDRELPTLAEIAWLFVFIAAFVDLLSLHQ